MSNERDILSELERRSRDGQDVAALDLQLAGLIAARDGDLARSTKALVAAQAWESANGYVRAALHTSHKLALTTNFAGDLEKLDRYYKETLHTVKRLHNREGLALCLRSVGELALLRSNQAELTKAWELSERIFTTLGLSEANQVAIWIACVREP